MAKFALTLVALTVFAAAASAATLPQHRAKTAVRTKKAPVPAAAAPRHRTKTVVRTKSLPAAVKTGGHRQEKHEKKQYRISYVDRSVLAPTAGKAKSSGRTYSDDPSDSDTDSSDNTGAEDDSDSTDDDYDGTASTSASDTDDD